MVCGSCHLDTTLRRSLRITFWVLGFFFYDISCISFGISLALFLYGHGWVVIKTTFSIFGISSNFKFNVNALLEFVHYDIRLSINMFNICLLLITRASATKFLWIEVLVSSSLQKHTGITRACKRNFLALLGAHRRSLGLQKIQSGAVTTVHIIAPATSFILYTITHY